MKGDVAKIVERPRDDHVVGETTTDSQGLLERPRAARQVTLAPVNLAKTDKRHGGLPRVVDVCPLPDRYCLLDEGARTRIVAVDASEPTKAQERQAGQQGIAMFPEQPQ